MPVPTTIADLSTTAASNFPTGSDSPASLDDVQRAHGAFIAQLRDGAHVPSATAKTTPVDADLIPINDSAASNIIKKVTWANVKATLKTYFDTLYASVGSFAASGANSDITSLNGPALGAATATTASVGDNDTSVATTAFVNAEISNDVGVANSSLVKTAINAVGSAGIYAVRAWCKFDGTLGGTNAPAGGGNVTSVVTNSTGNYTINFSTAMSDLHFAVAVCASGASGQYETARTTSSVTVQIVNTAWSAANSAIVSVQVSR